MLSGRDEAPETITLIHCCTSKRWRYLCSLLEGRERISCYNISSSFSGV